MKRILHTSIFACIALMLATSCTSTDKLLRSGNYDQAVDQAVKKLRRKKTKDKQVYALHEAFHKANQRDLERADVIKREGQPTMHRDLLHVYQRIQYRQDKVKPLLPLSVDGLPLEFKLIDVNDQLVDAKKKAAEYLYQNALSLIQSGDKYKARQALHDLDELHRIFPRFKNAEDLRRQAYELGMNWVVFGIENSSRSLVPVEFVDELARISLSEADGGWFTLSHGGRDNYDYRIQLKLVEVEVSPESNDRKSWNETKRIQDGTEFAVDSKGNFVLDSTGNKIEIPRYVEINCEVRETIQRKSSILHGHFEIMDTRGKHSRLLKTTPFTVVHDFEHYSAEAFGNTKALSKETLKKIGNQPMPFPSDFQMIMDGAARLKGPLFDFIRGNRGLLEG